MEGDKEDNSDHKHIVVAKSAVDIQRLKLEKLMRNPNKPVFIPEKSIEKLPRAFNPPEIVRNIWGSSAGAGSGDFHVYRGVRRREYARQKYLDEKAAKDGLDQECVERLENNKLDAEQRTAKKRIKRLRKRDKERRNKDAKKGKMLSVTQNNTSGSQENYKNKSESDDSDHT